MRIALFECKKLFHVRESRICLTLNKQFMFLMLSHKAVLTTLIFIELIPIARFSMKDIMKKKVFWRSFGKSIELNKLGRN